jgi:pilus assembly protein FimV
MFITCQECNTTYRLDEKLLKPAGSKVRCSQCQFVFVARPPAPEPSAPDVLEPPVSAPWVDQAEAQPAAAATDTFGGQELEGIDLAEFDALLEQDPAFGPEPGADAMLPAAERSEVDSALDELDSVDLDFDFETALEPEEDSRDLELSAGDDAEEIDLDMDFNIFDDDTLVGEKEMLTNPDAASLNSMDAPVAEKQEVLAAEHGAPGAEPAFDDMDLDLDFDLDSDSQMQVEDEKPPVDQTQTQKSPMKDDLELGDLDLELEEDSDQPAEITEEPELSLDDDNLPDPAESMPEEMIVDDRNKADDVDEASDLDLDFDLDLDLESDQPDASANTLPVKPVELAPEQPEAAKASFDDLDDLDLSDLDTLMTTTGDLPAGQDQDESDPDLDLDLDMDLELGSDLDAASTDTSASPKAQAVAEEVEDLDFSLDAEEDNSAASSLDPGDTLAEEEIDLSDIEQMLGSDGAEVKKAGKYVQPREENLGMGDDDAIDIAEIESAIDDASMISERKSSDDTLDDQELVLDLDFNFDKPFKETAGDLEHAPAGDAGSSSAESLEFDLEMELEGAPDSKGRKIDADDDELDLSDFGDLIEEDTNRKGNSEIINSGDIELEFQLEGDGDDPESNAKAAPVKRPAAKAPAKTSSSTTDSLLAESKPVASPRPMPFRTKKKTSKSLIALFILLMIGVSGYGLYYAVMEKGIAIPYVGDYVKQVSDYFNPGPTDPDGILNLSTLDINNKFIDHEEAGRLFVITGKVRNGYSTSRDRIRVEGKLFTTGKVLAETALSYAGFVINDQDLASLPISEISRRLNSPPQGSSVETAVGPGQNLGFMLVFSNLPPVDQLDQFEIALISSAPRQ